MVSYGLRHSGSSGPAICSCAACFEIGGDFGIQLARKSSSLALGFISALSRTIQRLNGSYCARVRWPRLYRTAMVCASGLSQFRLPMGCP